LPRWQRNFRRIPPRVIERVESLSPGAIVVGAVKRIPKSDIEDGIYRHLGLIIDGNEPSVITPDGIVPPVTSGLWSRTNVQGRWVRLKDLPMIQKEFFFEAPNYGDWSKGSHTMSWTRLVYQKKLIPAKELALKVGIIGRAGDDQNTYLISFAVEGALDPASPTFADSLFYSINLLQENTGVADVQPSEMSAGEYLDTLYVDWEILPPGERGSRFTAVLRGCTHLTPKQRRKIQERSLFFDSLGPGKPVWGSNGFRRYFGLMLSTDLVLFENVEYGNALYIMFENWEENSKLSRLELLSKRDRDFLRIPHRGDWQGRVRAVLNAHRAGLADQHTKGGLM